MAAPSYTYTLTNGTTADASQVTQNFTDILNGVSDGTKDLSINALTCAGTATFNGNVAIGNASGDDLSITASLATSIPIKTDASFDIGSSTKGLRKGYFGGNSHRVSIAASGSTSADWDLTLPISAGTSGYFLQTNGSGVSTWALPVAASSSAAGSVSYEDTSTVTFNFTGARSVSKSFAYERVGKTVTWRWDNSVSVAASAGSSLASGATEVPAALRPAGDVTFPVYIQDSNAASVGYIEITAAGQVTFGKTLASPNFTNGQNCGFWRGSVTYTIV